MWVGRRLEGIDVLRKRKQLLIAIAPKEVRSWFWTCTEVFASRNELVKLGKAVHTLIERYVTHEVLNTTVVLQACAIQIASGLKPEQVRYNHGRLGT